MKLTLPFCLIAACLLAGCATLNKHECQHANWYAIGLEDGAQGHGIERIGQHRQACAKLGIVPEVEDYRAGLDEGHSRYCTNARGYQRGRSGQNNPQVCRGQAAVDFNQAYNLGREHYRLKGAITDLDQQMDDYQQRLTELAEEASSHEQQLLHKAQDADTRRHHLQSLRAIEQEIKEVHESITYLERELIVAQEDLFQLQDEHRQLGFSF